MRHRINKIILLGLLALSIMGQQLTKYSGYCSQGGVVTQTAGINSTTKVVASYPGCTVQVNIASLLLPATLFSNATGTGKSNPFTADATTGYYEYFVAAGTYVDALSGGGGPTFSRAAVASTGPFVKAISVTTTSATSDVFAVTGVTTGSLCSVSAANTAAATNISTTFVSAIGANTVTVSHSGIASMIYTLVCVGQ